MRIFKFIWSIFAFAIVIADKRQLDKLDVVKISEMIQLVEQCY